MNNIAIQGGHNAGIAFKNRNEYRVLEFERFVNNKNYGFFYLHSYAKNPGVILTQALDFAEKEMGLVKEFDTCLFLTIPRLEGWPSDHFFDLKKYIKAKNYVQAYHHKAHAASVFYQSDFKEALTICFDGGGNDGFFKVYLASKKNGIQEIFSKNIDFGWCYSIVGHFCDEIKQEQNIYTGNLVYSGKLMGLCGYGKIRPEWINSFDLFFSNFDSYKSWNDFDLKYSLNFLNECFQNTNLKFDPNNRFKNEISFDVAATLQFVFEKKFIEITGPFLNRYKNLPICLSGGCALNVILNTNLKNLFNRNIFIAPNSNDSGLALGMLLDFEKPANPIDATYIGAPPIDKYALNELLELKNSFEYSASKAAEILAQGKIIGTIMGNSEHGPRALGNRSILCDPSIENIKNILNDRIKKREWYRPFAPIVRLEDLNEYFDFNDESRHMVFYAKVRDRWKNKLNGVSHIDGTARIQTITRQQNPKIYDLITEFKNKTGLGVLLNTSFNVNGKPLINSYKDCIKMLDSGLDYIFTDDFIIY